MFDEAELYKKLKEAEDKVKELLLNYIDKTSCCTFQQTTEKTITLEDVKLEQGKHNLTKSIASTRTSLDASFFKKNQIPEFLKNDGFQTLNQYWNLDINSLLINCNTHEHTETCYKKKKNVCRFMFGEKGKPLVEKTTINFNDEEEEKFVISIKRTNGWIADYNSWFSFVLRCNNYVTPLFGHKSGLAISYYLTSYTTKVVLNNDQLWDLVVKAVQSLQGDVKNGNDRRC